MNIVYNFLVIEKLSQKEKKPVFSMLIRSLMGSRKRLNTTCVWTSGRCYRQLLSLRSV